MKLNIQNFSDKMTFNQAEQTALLSGTQTALNQLVNANNTLITAMSYLSENWHSTDATKVGNEAASSLKKLCDSANQYVASITTWFANHACNLNVINGESFTLKGTNEGDVAQTKQINFTNDTTRIGLTNPEVAANYSKQMQSSTSEVESALDKVLSAASSNPDALPLGVVDDTLVPTINSENGKVKSSLSSFREDLTSMVEALSQAISAEAQSARSGAAGK